ncbi:MAG TPA: amidohydrolase family protein [Xanthobacteraceae bacterium]|nr:amidohydrolase family protein [Xanthobacteraceae bacterium]
MPALAIEGGRLIDGTGRAPIERSLILIENGRFKFVGRISEHPVPPGATVLDVTGKTVLPGFIDGHGHLEDFHGETYLNLGITTCVTIEIYQDGPWTLAQKRGTDLGKIRGPRIWTSGRAIGGSRTATDAPSARAVRGNIVVTTAEETRNAVRRKKDLGYDLIKLNEFLPFDLVSVACEEAHRLGLPVTAHSWDAIAAAEAGVDAIEHIWSVGYSSILDSQRRRELAEQRLAGNIDQELAGSYYEPENFAPVIDAMVARGVAWTPTIAKWLRPLSPSAQRFRAREDEILNDPNADLPAAVRAVTENSYDKLNRRYRPEQLARAKIGYDKANEFIRRFVAAGGLLKEGSDPPRGMAALLMHQALVMDVEAGVAPMTAIQSATLNVAKAFKQEKDYGSVEPGKVADLSIIEGDPLADIWATQNVKHVVMDGRIIEMGFRRYKNPIPSFYSYQTLPPDLELSPLLLTQGAGPTRLSVRGRGMWPFHKVTLNGRELPTRYVSSSELEATIASEAIARPGTYIVTVRSEGEPLAESHRAHLVVGFRD